MRSPFFVFTAGGTLNNASGIAANGEKFHVQIFLIYKKMFASILTTGDAFWLTDYKFIKK
ncbi:hypothetical protein [uncultured Desulfobacter sp.]|uniref:hypothetical protein n=1 Tax=uncultured Desulfobacter sp. TaxID=240139 RepID=UPI002AABF463|nr:hypothetical protein [uncultured Desulfobacter sp.]